MDTFDGVKPVDEDSPGDLRSDPPIQLKPVIEAIRADATLAGIVNGTDHAKLRTEVYALTALLIEDFWRFLHAWIETHTPPIGIRSPRGLRHTDTVSGEGSRINQLRTLTMEVVFDHLERWQLLLDTGPPRSPLIDRVHRRFNTIMHEHHGPTASLQVKNGLGNAVYLCWALCEVIPRVWEKQFKTPISQEEFRTVIDGQEAISLLLRLAQMFMHDFLALQDKFMFTPDSKVPDDDTLDWQMYMKEDAFFFSEKDGKVRLEFAHDHAIQLARDINEDLGDPRIGCPALFVKGSQQNVIVALWQWIHVLATEFYVPLHPLKRGTETTAKG